MQLAGDNELLQYDQKTSDKWNTIFKNAVSNFTQ